MAKVKAKTRAQLERENLELHAQLAHVGYYVNKGLPSASRDALAGSGVLLQLHALGGRKIIDPIVIRDGLSADTIAALQRDVIRSYELATQFKPKV
jgi:hypothetical protein